MTKNILKKFYLTDEYEDDDVFLNEDSSLKTDDNTIIEDSDYDSDSDSDSDKEDDEEPKIEFIVEEDENKEKQIRMNFEFKVNNLNEVVKIDLEISKKTYLEIADELMK